jgi:hypothetical protein
MKSELTLLFISMACLCYANDGGIIPFPWENSVAMSQKSILPFAWEDQGPKGDKRRSNEQGSILPNPKTCPNAPKVKPPSGNKPRPNDKPNTKPNNKPKSKHKHKHKSMHKSKHKKHKKSRKR